MSSRPVGLMSVLPAEVADQILRFAESLCLHDHPHPIEDRATPLPVWYAPASVFETFHIHQANTILRLEHLWRKLQAVSHFWYRAVQARRATFPFTAISSKPLHFNPLVTQPIQSASIEFGSTHNSALAKRPELLIFTKNLGSLTLRKYGPKPIMEAWKSLTWFSQLKELTIHQSLSIPTCFLFDIFDSCSKLEQLKLLSLPIGPTAPVSSNPPSCNTPAARRPSRGRLRALTFHSCLASPPTQSSDLLNSLLARSATSLKALTIVFEGSATTAEMTHQGPNAPATDHLRERLSACQGLETLQVSVPDETLGRPFLDPLLNDLPHLQHLHMKGNPFSPSLFMVDCHPCALVTLSCDGYSRPILPLLRALRTFVSLQSTLQSLRITTHRRAPRNFKEALYGELDLPALGGELTMRELEQWDERQAEGHHEQDLLAQDCRQRNITLDGPRPYITPRG